jgi:hypothetical protein
LSVSALELSSQPVSSMLAVPVTAVSSESVEGRPAASRLRDALRQPVSTNGEAPSKPYRLTAEERQRLREQLRGGPEQAARNP